MRHLRAAAVEAALAETEEAESPLPGLLEIAARGDQAAVEAGVEEKFGSMGPQEMAELQMSVAQDPSPENPANAVAAAMQAAVEKRMVTAKDMVMELLDNPSGNNIADVRKVLKKADNPLPLLMVLQLNIQQAQQDNDQTAMQALTHIYTVINEEMEKKVSKVQGLLSKLLRMEDASIRENILRHHLQPAEVAAAPDIDGFDDDEPSTPALTAALVPPGRLAQAITELVANVDQSLKQTLGEYDEGRFETLDKIRTVAKEARMIVFDIYGQAECDAFSADLTPAFHTLMEYKSRMESSDSAVRAPSAAEAAASRGNAKQVGSQDSQPSPGETAPMPE